MKPVQIPGSKKLSSFIKPMTATLSDKPAFDHKDWLFEIKWDGYRAIAEVGGENIRFYSRNGNTFDKAYPTLFKELQKIKIPAIIDGEIVVFDESGNPSFQKLQNYSSNKKFAIQFMVFDCLMFQGKDATHLPLLKRKALLQEILPENSRVLYCDHVLNNGKELFKQVKKIGLEGIIAKKIDSRYHSDRRSKEWLKIKNIYTDDFVIVGLTPPQGSRSYFGSLVIAEKQKAKLIFRGNVGTGFTESMLKDIHQELLHIVRKTAPLTVPENFAKEVKDVVWLEPKFVCQVKYTEITADGSVRHPSFQGLRIDK
jgi:bifunctional non-homologous end joining protein LigD